MRKHETILKDLVSKEGRRVLFEAKVTYRNKSEGPHYIADFAKWITVTISITKEDDKTNEEKFGVTYLIDKPNNNEIDLSVK